MTEKKLTVTDSGALMLADHAGLDLLNTTPQVDGELVDMLQSDADVVRWLEQAGFAANAIPEGVKAGSLLQAARQLREAIRPLVERRKAGKQGDVAELNAFLAAGSSYPQLVWGRSGAVRLERVQARGTVEQMLAPMAEAAAELLANGDFELVRKCEDAACVLWFYDRTKSHHRRWCSMATCGNRNKVAAYRRRRVSASV